MNLETKGLKSDRARLFEKISIFGKIPIDDQNSSENVFGLCKKINH